MKIRKRRKPRHLLILNHLTRSYIAKTTTHSMISFKAYGVVFDNPFPTILHYEDAICDSTLGKILVNYLRRSSKILLALYNHPSAR